VVFYISHWAIRIDAYAGKDFGKMDRRPYDRVIGSGILGAILDARYD
jgi:hypothetical protein